MTVTDIYFEFNRFNRANLRQDHVDVPFFIDAYSTISRKVCPGESRFVLVGINPTGEVLMSGFCNRNRRLRLEYKWRDESGCKYFLVCRRKG